MLEKVMSMVEVVMDVVILMVPMSGGVMQATCRPFAHSQMRSDEVCSCLRALSGAQGPKPTLKSPPTTIFGAEQVVGRLRRKADKPARATLVLAMVEGGVEYALTRIQWVVPVAEDSLTRTPTA